jgi:hypothetical protein
MKLIDNRGRLFGIINIFDLLALAAVILVVSIVGYRLAERNAEKKEKAGTKTWVATVKCPSVPDRFAESLMMDTRVYYDADGFVNAKVIDAEEEAAAILVAGSGGQVEEGRHPSLKDVYVTVEIEDIEGDACVKVGRYAVSVGGKFTLKTPYAYAQDGIVIDLREK